MNKRVLPTSEPGRDGERPTKEDPPLIIIGPEISKAVFAFYEGGKMTKRDCHEARVLAALYQIAKNLYAIHAQSIVNAQALIEAIRSPACPGCGK